MSSRGNGTGTRAGARLKTSVAYTRATSQARLTAIAGREVPPNALAGLTGAGAGARAGAQIAVSGGYVTATWQENGHTYETAIMLSRRASSDIQGTALRPAIGSLTMANFSFSKDGNPSAPLEAWVLSQQITAARALGVQVISMKGRSGSDDWTRLPQMGFNAPVDQYLRAEIPGGQLAQIPAGATLRDMLSSAAGRSWWAGLTPAPHPTLYLDVSKGSPDMAIFNSYRRQQKRGA